MKIWDLPILRRINSCAKFQKNRMIPSMTFVILIILIIIIILLTEFFGKRILREKNSSYEVSSVGVFCLCLGMAV